MFAKIIAIIITIIAFISFVIAGGVDGDVDGGIEYTESGPTQRGLTILGGAQLTDEQEKAAIKYAKLKRSAHKISFEDFCFPKKFKLQNPQKFIGKYLSPGTPNMNLLGFHKIGAGKTCAAIAAAELWLPKGKPMVVMPASLVPGFRNELRGYCPVAVSNELLLSNNKPANSEYITEEERELLKTNPPSSDIYKQIIKKSDALIDSKYTIMSYNMFVKEGSNYNPPLLIIDEVHNINNPRGLYYNRFMKFIESNPDMKLLVLSATPIFDHESELISLLQLMRVKNATDNWPDCLDGLISYYEGAPSYTFPKTTLHYEICKMSKFQSKWFTAEVEAEIKRSGSINLHEISNNFYAKSRAKSNMVFPHGLSGTDGLPLLTGSKIANNLDKYSCKYMRLIKKLKKGELSFVYTSFTSFGGIKSIRKCLEVFGFSEYSKHGVGPKRFAIWSGDQTAREKDAIRKIFNSPENDDGSLIQIIIGSPAIKEGVSLLRVRQVHVLEPYWNHSRLEQIYGRAIRFCSHKSLPKKDRHVDIYLYIAVTDKSKCNKRNYEKYKNIPPIESIDMYILNIADKKRDKTNEIISTMIDWAVDKPLNQ